VRYSPEGFPDDNIATDRRSFSSATFASGHAIYSTVWKLTNAAALPHTLEIAGVPPSGKTNSSARKNAALCASHRRSEFSRAAIPARVARFPRATRAREKNSSPASKNASPIFAAPVIPSWTPEARYSTTNIGATTRASLSHGIRVKSCRVRFDRTALKFGVFWRLNGE